MNIKEFVKEKEAFEGLEIHLKRNLQKQKELPGAVVRTYSDLDSIDDPGHADITPYGFFMFVDASYWPDPYSFQALGIRQNVTNCAFDIYDGSFLAGEDGKPTLVLKLNFWDFQEIYKKFKKHAVAQFFNEVKHENGQGDMYCQCYIDCGDDVETMAKLFTVVLTEVYEIPFAHIKVEGIYTHVVEPKWGGGDSVVDVNEAKKYMKEALSTKYAYKNTLFIPTDNGLLLVKNGMLDKVKKLMDEYNTKYSKYTGTKYSLVENGRLILTSYCEYETTSNYMKAFYIGCFKITKANMIDEKIEHLNEIGWK